MTSYLKNQNCILNYPQNSIKTSNGINTAKQTIQNFLFKNLQEQFSKLPNIQFLIISILQVIPETSSTDGVPVVLPSLCTMVMISMAKDIQEDLNRYYSDLKENRSKTTAYYNCCQTYKNWAEIESPKGCKQLDWQDLQPGMLVYLSEDEPVPADLIILYSSDDKGSVFVETKSLDGESAHKQRQACMLTSNIVDSAVRELELQDIRGVENIKLQFEYDLPNDDLNRFHGTVQLIDDTDENDRKYIEHIHKNNILLRGTTIKSTRWVIGAVAQTGHETKVMMNCISAQSKTSTVFKFMNINVVYIFLAQVTICLTLGILSSVQLEDEAYYTSQGVDQVAPDKLLNILKQFGSWTILSTNFVPISLMVTLEFISLFQTSFIVKDFRFFNQGLGTGCLVQSSNLHEELGMIDTIFTDKTGTLTKNEMKLKCIYTNQTEYGKMQEWDYNREDKQHMIENEYVDFQDTRVRRHVQNYHENKELIEFLLSVSICHSIITDNMKNQVAQSPEEMSLVMFASELGIKFVDRNYKDGSINMMVQGRSQVVKVRTIIEFTSERKCMSVLVEHGGRFILYSKGADNVIMKKASKLSNFTKYLDCLEKWSTQGFRTLLQSIRQIPAHDAEMFISEQNQVISDNEQKARRKELELKIEKNLLLIGAVAIEDKLQDDVADVLEQFKTSGIRINMLTGDKLQTAINVGKACRIIEEETIIQIINFNEKSGMYKRMRQIQNEILQNEGDYCLVVSGDCYSLMQDDKELQAELGKTMGMVDSLICCRLSPKQKALLISKQREINNKSIVLAIGDGANDVNMISMAHVGIGIQGKDGVQAARASDYAIAEFKMLRRLLFSQGSEFQRKNTTAISQFFQKNMMVTSPQFFQGIFTLFTHGIFQDTFQYQSFNVFYTSWPVIFFAVHDRLRELDDMETDITLMKKGHSRALFNQTSIWGWILFGLFMSSMQSQLQINLSMENPGTSFSFNVSNTSQMITIFTTNLNIFLAQNHHSWFTVLIILASASFFFFADWGFVKNMSSGRQQLSQNQGVWFSRETGYFVFLAVFVIISINFCFEFIAKQLMKNQPTADNYLQKRNNLNDNQDKTSKDEKMGLDKLKNNKNSQNYSKIIKTQRKSQRNSVSPTKLEHFSGKNQNSGKFDSSKQEKNINNQTTFQQELKGSIPKENAELPKIENSKSNPEVQGKLSNKKFKMTNNSGREFE